MKEKSESMTVGNPSSEGSVWFNELIMIRMQTLNLSGFCVTVCHMVLIWDVEEVPTASPLLPLVLESLVSGLFWRWVEKAFFFWVYFSLFSKEHK